MSAPATKVDRANIRLGLIGLGLMGSHLTRRLHSSGWHIQAWNRSPGLAKEINKEGIPTAPSIADLVTHSDFILSSLANDAAVRSVHLDKGGVFSLATPGAVILEMSTISPDLSLELHQHAQAKGLDLLDVAISGDGTDGVFHPARHFARDPCHLIKHSPAQRA